MKAFHAAALFTTFLVLWFSMANCAHATAVTSKRPSAFILPYAASGSDQFCVEIEPAPLIHPGDQGLRCVDVQSLRIWLAGQRGAH